MNTLLIYLDLGPISQLFYSQQIIPYLQGTGTWAKLSEKLWLIKTTRNSAGVRDDLRGMLAHLSTSADKILVINIGQSSWASLNLPQDVVSWLENNI